MNVSLDINPDYEVVEFIFQKLKDGYQDAGSGVLFAWAYMLFYHRIVLGQLEYSLKSIGWWVFGVHTSSHLTYFQFS